MDFFKKIELVATDMDGTLTQAGKFTPALLDALEQLAIAQIPVLIVTGRSAGWVSAIVHYLPVVGAIAENGGLYYMPNSQRDTTEPELLVSLPNGMEHRQKLATLFQQLQVEFPSLQESADNRFRITDWTFDVAGLSLNELETLRDRCHAAGWGFTYSTVQCHIKPIEQEKSAGLLQVLRRHFPRILPDQVVTVGDSPNDESLFKSDFFPYSIGVANVRHYLDQMVDHPQWITTAAEAAGFCELAEILVERQ